ncbi:hypothetical protein [Nocardioides sp. Soil796]|uniref:hypothetical protein n=1 Tax=Nocardioides sp. Soil796 TaxID=1736412 RepID=UPI00070CEFE4|nr:hypothetical protein [Nocardioides sp. Soil796]KRF19657.1 hypothetical protein ASH02_24185 [Nocardioides sp. Soil796]
MKVTLSAADFTADTERRTLTGLLLPFNAVSRPAADPRTGKVSTFSFSEGTVTLPEDPSDVILNYGHDRESMAAQVGVGAEFTLQPEGVQAKFRIARTPEGDRVLALAEDRILKSFSAEVEGEFVNRGGVQHAVSTNLYGAAIALKPAFVGAHITSVAASAATEKGNHMTDETTEKVEATQVSFSADEGKALATKVTELATKIEGLADIKVPVTTAQFAVKEEPIYRFSGHEGAPSGFDFATDILNAARYGDQAAFKRVQDFTAEYIGADFVDTGDTTAVNQPTYRPDMFLGQAPVPTSPMFDTFRKGGLSDITPFFYSKLDRAATNVGVADHVEGTDPTNKDLVTVAGATVSPVPVSGKVHITREVGDQGGNPQVSGLVWAEFERSFKIALETKTAALVNAATVTSLTSAIAAGATGAVAGQAIEAGLLGLQFLADGSRFTKSFGHVDLYTVLATYENADGEKRYPIINPQNRDGISGAKYSFLDIAGYRMEPGHSLGATGVNSKSYVADPGAVHVWNSGLNRFDKLTEKVEGWDIGCFAYFAGIVYDVSGLRQITYTKA